MLKLYKLFYPFIFIYELINHLFYKYKIFKEIIFITIIFFVFTISLMFQFRAIQPFPWLVVKTVNIDNFFLSIFQIQAIVATLGIAIITMISGLIDKKHYGISITNYVLNLKPKILKHRLLIISNLFFILINFLFCANGLYDLVSAVLICSILICIKLTSDIYKVFKLGSDIKYEIRTYVNESISKNNTFYNRTKFDHILSDLSKDLDSSITANDYSAIIDDVNMINELVCFYVNPPFIYHKDLFLRECQNFSRDYERAVRELYRSHNVEYINLYIESLKRIYSACTSKKIHIDLWENNVSKEFFNIIKLIDPSTLFSGIRKLRLEIYDNILENQDTWQSVINFLPTLYESLKDNRLYTQLNPSIKQKIWDDFINTDTMQKTNWSPITETRFLTEPRREELNTLFKMVIDNYDTDVLSVIFPVRNPDYSNVGLSNVAYTYSSVNRLNNNDDLKQRLLSILYKNGPAFYFDLSARDAKNLLEHCKAIIYYFSGNKYINFEEPIIDFALDYHGRIFVFYYILFHLKRIDNDEITAIINWYLGPHNKDNGFNCFFCMGNTKDFLSIYRYFLKTVLGNHYSLIEEEHFNNVLAYCKEYFSEYLPLQ